MAALSLPTQSTYSVNMFHVWSHSALESEAQVWKMQEITDTHSAACKLACVCISGGGRKVITVEVSLDGGNTWLISCITRGEEPSEYGKHWCWVFWQVQVPLMSFIAAEELRCRAVDSSNNAQPEK